MATLHQLQAAVLKVVQEAVPSPVIVGGRAITVMSAIGWPPENELQNVAKKGNNLSVISVYDRKIARNSTRWSPYTVSTAVTKATLTTSVSVDFLSTMGSSQIALGASVTPGDAVSAIFTNESIAPALVAAVVVSGAAGDTPPTMATKLAAAINADTLISTWASATAVGPVVTVISLVTTGQLGIQSFSGNGATEVRELARRMRQLQISVWAQPEEVRQAVTDPIEVAIARFDADFGVQMPDGTYARIAYVSDHYMEDATLEDVLRRDFYISADYAITVKDMLYSVLAPVPQFSID